MEGAKGSGERRKGREGKGKVQRDFKKTINLVEYTFLCTHLNKE